MFNDAIFLNSLQLTVIKTDRKLTLMLAISWLAVIDWVRIFS